MERIKTGTKKSIVRDIKDGATDHTISEKHKVSLEVVGEVRSGNALKPKNVFSKMSNKRGYNAGKVNSLNQDFNPYDIFLDNINLSDIYSVDTIRARARDLERNTEYTPRYLTIMMTNVIGPKGIQFKSMASDTKRDGELVLDKLSAKAIESAWSDWCYTGNCSTNYSLNFVEIQLQALRAIIRDGESLTRKHYSPADGFRLEVLDPGMISSSTNSYNANTNQKVSGGIEMDRFNNPISFYLGELGQGGANDNQDIVSAAELIHVFRRIFPTDVRGISWLAPVMESLHQLDKYTEATVIASRVAASTSAYITSPEEEWTGDDDDYNEHTHLEPGVIGSLNPGEDIKFIDPKFPQSTYSDFVNTRLSHIASGLNISYASLTGDRNRSNNASQRIATQEEQDGFRMVQNLMIDDFLKPIFKEWLKFALTEGSIKLPTGKKLTLKQYDKLSMCSFMPRGFISSDPLKDAQVMAQELSSGVKSWNQLVVEKGGDPQETLQQIATDKANFEKLGLIYPGQGSIMPEPIQETIEVDKK